MSGSCHIARITKHRVRLIILFCWMDITLYVVKKCVANVAEIAMFFAPYANERTYVHGALQIIGSPNCKQAVRTPRNAHAVVNGILFYKATGNPTLFWYRLVRACIYRPRSLAVLVQNLLLITELIASSHITSIGSHSFCYLLRLRFGLCRIFLHTSSL